MEQILTGSYPFSHGITPDNAVSGTFWEQCIGLEDQIVHLLATTEAIQAFHVEAILCNTVLQAQADTDTCTALLHWANALYAKSLQYVQIHSSVFGDTYQRFCREFCRDIQPEDFQKQHHRLLTAYSDLWSASALKPYSTLTKSVIHHIQSNLSTRLDLSVLSSHTGFSPTYISHRFKKEVGVSPMRYVTQERIRIAIYLLRTSDRSIQDIAGSIGFTDMSYFSKLFKQITGCSPSQFRDSL